MLARRARCSAAALAQAAGGERLPSLAVVRAYAHACGGDPAARGVPAACPDRRGARP
ncbi:hypothetical protein [Streptomyces sp. NBC_00986]|uniref:hypothetical protein n=1 Tax=Streptomyces sp. NBC_00986 TaxID=2903702 RepID=UPI003865064E